VSGEGVDFFERKAERCRAQHCPDSAISFGNLLHDAETRTMNRAMVLPLTADEVATLRARVLAASTNSVSQSLGVSRETLTRAIAGVKIHAGSIVLIRAALAK
jgi:hypothetical protein